MGWKRINGRSYYYRSVRDGGRVRSEYVGSGETAALIAQLDTLERERRDAERRDECAEREAAEDSERRFADWFDRVEALARAALILLVLASWLARG